MAHIQRAWKTRSLDPEMAAFRAITGEEESATAIFHALRRRKYIGSRTLNPHNHRLKSGVIPFLDVLALAFTKLKPLKLHPTLEVDTRRNPKRLRLRLTMRFPDGEDRRVYPEPPLGFTTKFDGVFDDFSDAISSLASKHGVASLVRHIEKRANYRNRLLYASSSGIPKVVGAVDPPLLLRRDSIFRNLTIFLLVDQYPDRQTFAQQALDAFLGMMQLLPK